MFTGSETRSLYDRQNEVKVWHLKGCMDSMCAHVSQQLPFTFDDLEKWYNGYSTSDGTRLFNPWSVSCALIEGELREWWTESGIKSSFPHLDAYLVTGYDATIQDRIAALLDSDEDFRSKCQDLLNGEKINVKLDCIYSPFVLYISSPKHG